MSECYDSSHHYILCLGFVLYIFCAMFVPYIYLRLILPFSWFLVHQKRRVGVVQRILSVLAMMDVVGVSVLVKGRGGQG